MKLKKQRVGLFDSGLGGLSLLKTLSQTNPQTEFIYFADIKHLPYGEKTKKELNVYCTAIQDFLLSLGVDIVIIACNSASSLFIERKFYKNTALYNIISPAVKTALQISRLRQKKKIGILATPLTVRSNVYAENLLSKDPSLKIIQQSVPLLTAFVEKGQFHLPECVKTLENYLLPLARKKINILIPACTHHLFLIDEIKKIMDPSVDIVDPRDELIRCLPLLPQNASTTPGGKNNIHLYASQNSSLFLELAQKILNTSAVKLHIAPIFSLNKKKKRSKNSFQL